MVPNRVNATWLRLVSTTLVLATLALLGGCGGGSGAPNNPFAPPPTTPGPLSILPATPTVYANTPTTLTITGGVPPYAVFSSDTAVLPLAAPVTNGTIVLLPGNVSADTVVTITAQDSAGNKVSTDVTVRAAPIFNTLTITPASAACGVNTVCSGQTAIAKVTVTGAGGVGLPNRQVRFDVVSGAFAIESTDPAHPLVASLTVASDQFGVAQVVLLANAGAATQIALLRATELTSGNQQTAQFTIVQTINGSQVLSVVPDTVTITDQFSGECSTGFRIDYYIYGGTPPYHISSTLPGSVVLVNSTVLASGQPFTAITNGACVDPLTFTIVDAGGLQTTATLHNVPGQTAPPGPTPPPTLQVVPGSVTSSTSCAGAVFPEFIIGGSPPYNIYATPVQGTINPQVVKASGGEVDISTLPSPSSTIFTVIDSGSVGFTQQSATFTITCP